jgi:hypothetical protein
VFRDTSALNRVSEQKFLPLVSGALQADRWRHTKGNFGPPQK